MFVWETAGVSGLRIKDCAIKRKQTVIRVRTLTCRGVSMLKSLTAYLNQKNFVVVYVKERKRQRQKD